MALAGRVLIEDADGVLREYADRLVSYDVSDDYDQPGAECTLTLWRDTAAGSIAPGITASPLNRDSSGRYAPAIYMNRRLVIQDPAPGGGWETLFDGVIRRVDPTRAAMTIWAPDRYNTLLRARVEKKREYVFEEGLLLEDVFRLILAEHRGSRAPELYVPRSPGFVVRQLTLEEGSLGEQLQAHALGTVGWKLRWWKDEGPASEGWQNTGAFRLTLFDPDRDKEAPDHYFAADDWIEVPRHESSDEDVRNRIWGGWHQDGVSVEATPLEDPQSQALFDVIALGLVEPPGSPIDTEVEWQRMALAALRDLRDPAIEATREGPYAPRVRIMELLHFAPDGLREDDPGGLEQAVKSVRHSWRADRKRTVVDTRGSVAGATQGWLRRAGGLEGFEALARLLGFREIRRDEESITFGWERTALVADVLVWFEVHPVPIPSDPWPRSGPPQIQCGAEDEFALAIPQREHICFVQVEPRTLDGRGGPIWRLQVFGTQFDIIQDVPPIINPPTPPPAGVVLETVHGGACGTNFLRHRLSWEGEGLVYWWDDAARMWMRPPGANAAFSDPSPYEMDYAGGGWVLDEADGVETEILYRISRMGPGGALPSTEARLTQKIRRCGGDPPVDPPVDPPPGDPPVSLSTWVETRDGGRCTLNDVLIWSATNFNAAKHRLEYRLLYGRASDWFALGTQAAEGEQLLDVHVGQIDSTGAGPHVAYGVEMRAVLIASGATVALGTPREFDYRTKPCDDPGSGGGGGGGGGGGDLEVIE